jgi:hypothetical protein
MHFFLAVIYFAIGCFVLVTAEQSKIGYTTSVVVGILILSMAVMVLLVEPR